MTEAVPVRSAKALGKELAQLRFERGLTQDELADRLGLTRQYLNRLETGAQNLLLARLFEVLRELGAHVEVVDEHRGDPGGSPFDVRPDGRAEGWPPATPGLAGEAP